MTKSMMAAAAAVLTCVVTTTAPALAQGKAAQPVSFTAADVDAFERGFKQELEAMKKRPTTGPYRFGGMSPEMEEAARAAGAKASGLDLNRYRQVRDTILNVLRTLDVQGKIEGPVSVDLARVSAEQRKQLERDPFLDLPAASAAALRPKIGQLTPLWVTYINMTAVAG